jgi:DNA polymerase III subunit chi
MTEVQFHFNVPDRLLYACRLLRKALRSGAKGVAVSAPVPTLARLDKVLWTFDPQEFIPHVMLRRGETLAPRLTRTPIWLVEHAEQGVHHPVLVHLGEDPAVGFESFGRLIEIVSTDTEERETARRRWKHYAGRGYDLQRFDVGATPS